MSFLKNLPKFFRLPDSEIEKAEIRPGAFYLEPNKGKLYIDSEDSRIDLSPIRRIPSADELPTTPTGYVYITDSGSLYINVGGNWYEYEPKALGEATYMYRFEVVGRETELRFSSQLLGVSHYPEFDLLNSNYENISSSDWLVRGWEGEDYVIKVSGGLPEGVYHLKISYNVKNDSAGVYIQDDSSSAAAIVMSPGEHYIFTKPLSSLVVDTNPEGRGISTLQFSTADTFQFSAPATVKYTNSRPTFKANTTYYVTAQNGILSVSTVV